jgi:hypothetical protein
MCFLSSGASISICATVPQTDGLHIPCIHSTIRPRSSHSCASASQCPRRAPAFVFSGAILYQMRIYLFIMPIPPHIDYCDLLCAFAQTPPSPKSLWHRTRWPRALCFLILGFRRPRLSLRSLHECARGHYLSNGDCCSWRDLCVNHIRCILYVAFHNPRIPASIHVSPFLEPTPIRRSRNSQWCRHRSSISPQRRPFVHARVTMAATSTKGVPFGTSPSLWLSAVLRATTLLRPSALMTRSSGSTPSAHPVLDSILTLL